MLSAVRADVLAGALVAVAFCLLAQGSNALGEFEAHTDVGLTPVKGDAHYNPGTRTYSVTGGGANMWLKEDAFQFLYKRITGDVTLSADVSFQGHGKEPHRKAALIIRKSLDADSAYADAAVHGDGLTALQYRPGDGVDTSEFRVAIKSPKRVGIERHGNEITIFASDGVDEATTGPVIISMSGTVYVGFAVCSHNAEELERADFSNVKWDAKGLSQAARSFELMAKHSRERLPLR